MPVVLGGQSYGKSRVRLTKVQRYADRHDLIEWTLDVRLAGDFAAAYTVGDNRNVVATDTMKNTVYALARDHALAAPEAFADTLARHFLTYPQVSSATIGVVVAPWQRVDAHAFVGGGPGQRTGRVERTRVSAATWAGVAGMTLLKTTDSAFRDFHSDALTTLPDTDDRIFATELSADWHYTADVDFDAAYERVIAALVATFAGHKSLGVQQTLYAMGEAALETCDAIDAMTLTMPNRHRLLVNLAPLGRENPNEVFVATDEPHGTIVGTVKRKL